MATRKKKNNIGAFGHPIYGKGFAKYGEMRPSGSSEIPNDLEEAKEAYCEEHNDDCFDAIGDKCPHIRNAFIAGAKWQKEQDDRLVDIIYQQGIEKGKDEMRETLKRKEKK